MLQKFLGISALSALLVGSVQAVPPVAIWTSLPVEPGEAVMVFGGPWDSTSSVEVTGPDTRTLVPLKVTEDCVTFVYPEDWPQMVFSAEIKTSAGVAEFEVNAPDVWWLQGDGGKTASPAGWLRAFGRSMGYSDRAAIELRGDGETIRIPAESYDLYSLRTALPEDVPPGAYEVFIYNGLGEAGYPAGSISILPRKEPWPELVVNIVDYGAIPNDRLDDSPAIRAALAVVTENGGGILYVPRGRFGLEDELTLPPNTLLRGAGMTLSQIYWPDRDHPTGALLSGTHHFGVEEIFLAAGNIATGINVILPKEGDLWRNESILLRRVRTRFLHTDTIPREESIRRSQSGAGFRISGEFIRMIDCDFSATKGISSLHGDYMQVSGNRFSGSGNNQGLWIGGRFTIFEDNDLERESSSISNGTRCFYYRGNKLGAIYGDGDRETMTFDGGRATYKDLIISASPNTVTLKPGAWRDSPERWVGEAISIIGGKGAGQMRLVETIDDRKVTLDRPWDILPDETSYTVIGLLRSHLLFLDNQVRDGNPFQLYGGAVDVVLAGNQLQRCSGLHAFGMTKGGVPEPSWFIQFLGNEILEGNSVRGPWSFMVPAADSYLGFFDRGMKSLRPVYPLARVGVMRRNVLHNNAYLYAGPKVENILVENNLVKHADKGMVIKSKGSVLRGNRFENVTDPYGEADLTPSTPKVLKVTQFLVAGPFKNASGARVDTAVHPPEINLDVTHSYETLDGKRPWLPVDADAKGKVNLNSVFKNTDVTTAHAVAIVRAAKPVRVNVDYGSNFNTLCVVNGKRIGSSLRRPGPACVELVTGENLFHIISSHGSGDWELPLALTVIDPVEPGDLQVLSTTELKESPILQLQNAIPTGDEFPHALGVDWKLVTADNFNRTRVGTHWTGHFNRPNYIPTALTIDEGGLRSLGGTGIITWPRKIEAPVRVEFDVRMDSPRQGFGVLLGEEGKTRFMLDRERRHGYYFSGLGIGNCALARNMEVLNVRGGALTVAEPEQWHHVVFQFVPPRCQFIFDGKVRVDVEDSDWIEGLNEIALWGSQGVIIDNVRIYTRE